MKTSAQMNFTNEDRIQISHPLLYALMTYGDGSATKVPISNWNSWGLGSRGILTWLVMEALNVRRHPWHPDACQASAPIEEEAAGALKILKEHLDTPYKVEIALGEIRRIYDHTQSVFKRRGIRTVQLHRSLYDGDEGGGEEGYATTILDMSRAAKRLNHEHFDLPSNVLTSWCEGAGYASYPVTIQVEHPVENVLWSSDVIASKGEKPTSSAVESGEWIVLNRSLNGLLSVPADGVIVHRNSNLWRPSYDLEERIDSCKGLTSEERAEKYLAKQRGKLAPLKGYSIPHYRQGLLNLRWRDRLKIALQVMRTR